MTMMSSAAIKSSRLSRLMPCMYFIHCVRGSSGSGLRRYRYSAIWRSTFIKKLYPKDTVKPKKGSLRNAYGAGVRRICWPFFDGLRMATQSGDTAFLILMSCVGLRLRLLSAFSGSQLPVGWAMASMCRMSFSKKVFMAILLIGYWMRCAEKDKTKPGKMQMVLA